MSERQIQFQVGLFVIAAFAVGTLLIVQFGDLQRYWRETYLVAAHFQEASGVRAGTPVRLHGIAIGAVREVRIDDKEGGVLVVLEIDARRQLRADSDCALAVSLFGDSVVEFSGGKSHKRIAPNDCIEGRPAANPIEIVQRMEVNVVETLSTFKATSKQWEEVGQNLNKLMETKQGSLDEVVERAALALNEFTKTMRTADATLSSAKMILGDPKVQTDLKRTMSALPDMVDDTRKVVEEVRRTIAATRGTIGKIDENLDNLKAATSPLARRSDVMVSQIEHSLKEFDGLVTELNTFSRMVNNKDGALQRFVADPALYENLNRSANAMTVVLENLKPALRDLRVFADKVARHPEILGVSGALHISSGLKEPVIEQTGGVNHPRPFNGPTANESRSEKPTNR